MTTFDPNRLMTHSLRTLPAGEAVARILAAGLQAVDPAAAVRAHLQRSGDRLTIGDRAYDLADFRRVLVVGAGKAGLPMARAVVEVLGKNASAGCVIVKEGHAGGSRRVDAVEVIEAGHPLPDERGVQGTGRLATLLVDTTPQDLVLCLISGGGSALLTLPAEGLALGDLRALTDSLLACGATINEINTLRKHLDRVKGGGLARLAAPARVATLILSDVVGNPLDIIASGPTVPDPGTYEQAWGVLERYQIVGEAPRAVREHLQRGRKGLLPESPKPGDSLFDGVHNVLVGSNLMAAEAALQQAAEESFKVLLLTTYLEGEAREAGRALAALARQIAADGRPVARPACLVAGGETTVTLHGEGLGGRNQEMALGAVVDLAGLQQVALVTLATDGDDGPTDAAGAVVTGESLGRAQVLGLDPADHLARNDAYRFFDPLGDLLKPGPTHTNVNDLAFVFAF